MGDGGPTKDVGEKRTKSCTMVGDLILTKNSVGGVVSS